MFYPFFLVLERRFLSLGPLPARLLWDFCEIAAFIVVLLLWAYCSSYGFAGIVVGLLCCRNSVAVGLMCCSTAFVLPRPRPRRRAKRGARNLVYIYIYNIVIYSSEEGPPIWRSRGLSALCQSSLVSTI